MSARHKHASCYLRRGPTAHLRIVKEPAPSALFTPAHTQGAAPHSSYVVCTSSNRRPSARSCYWSTQHSGFPWPLQLRVSAGGRQGLEGPRDGVVACREKSRTRGGAASAGALFTRQQTTTTRTPSALAPTEEGAHRPGHRNAKKQFRTRASPPRITGRVVRGSLCAPSADQPPRRAGRSPRVQRWGAHALLIAVRRRSTRFFASGRAGAEHTAEHGALPAAAQLLRTRLVREGHRGHADSRCWLCWCVHVHARTLCRCPGLTPETGAGAGRHGLCLCGSGWCERPNVLRARTVRDGGAGRRIQCGGRVEFWVLA